MIIFGFRRMVRRLAVLTLLCANCRNPTAHGLDRLLTVFTLFFVPVLPLYVRRTTRCTFCGFVCKVTKQEAQSLVDQARQSAGFPPNGAPGSPFTSGGPVPYPGAGYPQHGGMPPRYPAHPYQGQRPY
ncbi:hypothetical protein [Actinopolyspora mortivallis]|uniref:hypothetical protein n=1 Tax=Actinopolyspora mortivallis TaxID=33906 RepID=UPI0003694AF3|nr:hypothetical protein [Actinopolyspora mortivallis]